MLSEKNSTWNFFFTSSHALFWGLKGYKQCTKPPKYCTIFKLFFYFICILQSTVIRDNQAQSWYFVAPNPESKSWHQSQTPTSPKRRLQSKRILTFLFWSWALPPFYSPCFLNDEICLTKSSVRIITNWCAKRLLLFEAEFSSRPPESYVSSSIYIARPFFQCLLLQQSRLLLRMFFKKNTLYTKFLECNDKILVMDFWVEKNYQIKEKKFV